MKERHPAWNISLDRYARLVVEVTNGRAEIHLADGRFVTVPWKRPPAEGITCIERLEYTFADGTLTCTVAGCGPVTLELEQPGGSSGRDGRPVIYLDQGHWSTLARRIHAPDKVASRDAEPADTLIAAARAREVILPLSSAHFVETTPLFGTKRQQLAHTMLELSRGWYMANPISVRRAEITRAVGIGATGHGVSGDPDVFTRDPTTVFATTPDAPDPAGAVPELVRLQHLLTESVGNVDLLMDPERIEPDKTTGWCNQMAAVARNPEFRAMSAARRRGGALVLALQDAITEPATIAAIHESAFPPDQAAAALLEAVRAQGSPAPFLSLYADALGARLLDPGTKWTPNDLIDMLYLSCAAAHADLVAAERPATAYLNAAWRGRAKPCPVVHTLGDLVTRLQDL